jgi:hypothetical protein
VVKPYLEKIPFIVSGVDKEKLAATPWSEIMLPQNFSYMLFWKEDGLTMKMSEHVSFKNKHGVEMKRWVVRKSIHSRIRVLKNGSTSVNLYLRRTVNRKAVIENISTAFSYNNMPLLPTLFFVENFIEHTKNINNNFDETVKYFHMVKENFYADLQLENIMSGASKNNVWKELNKIVVSIVYPSLFNVENSCLINGFPVFSEYTMTNLIRSRTTSEILTKLRLPETHVNSRIVVKQNLHKVNENMIHLIWFIKKHSTNDDECSQLLSSLFDTYDSSMFTPELQERGSAYHTPVKNKLRIVEPVFKNFSFTQKKQLLKDKEFVQHMMTGDTVDIIFAAKRFKRTKVDEKFNKTDSLLTLYCGVDSETVTKLNLGSYSDWFSDATLTVLADSRPQSTSDVKNNLKLLCDDFLVYENKPNLTLHKLSVINYGVFPNLMFSKKTEEYVGGDNFSPVKNFEIFETVALKKDLKNNPVFRFADRNNFLIFNQKNNQYCSLIFNEQTYYNMTSAMLEFVVNICDKHGLEHSRTVYAHLLKGALLHNDDTVKNYRRFISHVGLGLSFNANMFALKTRMSLHDAKQFVGVPELWLSAMFPQVKQYNMVYHNLDKTLPPLEIF